MKRTLRWIILLSLVLAGVGYLLSQLLEFHTRQVNSGPTLEVSFNPWFAAQAFLQQQQIKSRRATDLQDLWHHLQPDDTLLLLDEKPVYDSLSQRKLMDWMNQGGHLVLTASAEWSDDLQASGDPFLDAMGVRLSKLGDTAQEAAEEEEAEQEPKPDQPQTPICTGTDHNPMFLLDLPGLDAPVQISFGRYVTLEDSSGNPVRDSGHSPNGLLEYQVGKGRMTVLAGTHIWSNFAIDEFDHAFLLWQLVNKDSTVWFVAQHVSENLLQMLWRTAPFLLIGCVIWLLLWAWRRGMRFGPLLPDPPTARRQQLEHIEASLTFAWKLRQLEPFIQHLRDDIFFHLDRQHATGSGNQHQRLEKLAALSGLPLTQVQQAMTCPVPYQEIRFTRLVSQLQTLRNAL